jgi:hypothetical protein
MEQQIAQDFLWSVYINAATLLVIVWTLAYVLIQIKRGTREITRTMSDVATMTRNVAEMTREILRRTE